MAVAAIVIIPRLGPPPSIDLDIPLARADAALAAGSLSTVRDVLLELRQYPADEEGAMRVLKRALAYARAAGDFDTLATVSGRAVEAGPRMAAVRAVAAYAQVRRGRLLDAQKTLDRGPVSSSAGRLLQGEVALRRGLDWTGFDSLTRELLVLPRLKTPGAYTSAARRTGDPRLSLDAALLAMGAGEAGVARSIAVAALGAAPFDAPVAAILYDAGDLAGALVRLGRLSAAKTARADTFLLMADALSASGKAAAAENALLRAVALSPGASWIPYGNLSTYALARGDLALADRRLLDGLAWFPRSRELLAARARLALRGGDTETARGILDGMAKEDPANVEAALMLLEVDAPLLTPEAYRARLWKLFNRAPGDATVLAALSSALIAARDWDGVRIALAQSDVAGGAESADLLLVRGMAAVMQGDDATGTELFLRASGLARDGRARYDLALVHLRRGNAKSALAALDVAEDEVRMSAGVDDEGSFLARIWMIRGSALMLEGNGRAARTALEQALRLDPKNLQAGLLMRKLVAEDQ